jgi:hypothetical protein
MQSTQGGLVEFGLNPACRRKTGFRFGGRLEVQYVGRNAARQLHD